MAQDYYYSVKSFNWVEEDNTFYASENDLWIHSHSQPFPNGREQFYIVNDLTEGFRRFRFKKETVSTEGNVEWIFESVDGILASILMNEKVEPIETKEGKTVVYKGDAKYSRTAYLELDGDTVRFDCSDEEYGPIQFDINRLKEAIDKHLNNKL